MVVMFLKTTKATMRTVCIYTLTDPVTLEIRYVGQSIHPDKRFKSHLSEARYRQTGSKNKWILDLLANNQKPILDVIEETTYGQRFVCENFWTDHYLAAGCTLYGIRRNCGGVVGYKPSETTIKKLKAAQNARPAEDRKRRALIAGNSKKTTARKVEFNGQELILKEWSNLTGLCTETIRYRLKIGWTPGQALGFEEAPRG